MNVLAIIINPKPSPHCSKNRHFFHLFDVRVSFGACQKTPTTLYLESKTTKKEKITKVTNSHT